MRHSGQYHDVVVGGTLTKANKRHVYPGVEQRSIRHLSCVRGICGCVASSQAFSASRNKHFHRWLAGGDSRISLSNVRA